MITPTPRNLTIPQLVIVGTLLLASCGSSSGSALTADDFWARPTAPDATAAAFYGTVTNDGDVPINFDDGYSRACERIEIHQSTNVDGVMSMSPADPAATQLDPGESLILEPMGLHVMCVGLVEPLVEGSTIDLEMTFDGAGAFAAEVEVEDR